MEDEIPLDDEGLNYQLSEDKQSFLEKMAEDRKDIIRSRVDKELKELELKPVDPAELEKVMTQFGTFASMQLLRIVGLKIYGNNANAMINEVIQSFITQGKETLMVKQQIDSIEQQDSKLASLLGEELAAKERELIAARVSKIYDQFEYEIKRTLLLEDTTPPIDDNDEDDEDDRNDTYPWER